MLKLRDLNHSNIKVFTLFILKKVHVYFSDTIVTGARSLKAPSLNLRRDSPLDVVP